MSTALAALPSPPWRQGATRSNASQWECPRCLALPCAPCTYTRPVDQVGHLVDGRYHGNIVGEPTQRMHNGRPRIKCLPIDPYSY